MGSFRTAAARPKPRVIGPAHPPVPRLRRCGASKEVLADIYARWNELDEAERIESHRALSDLTDDELRALLVEHAEELAGG